MLSVSWTGVCRTIVSGFLLVAGVAALNGCATVVMDGAAGVKSASAERDALKSAAADVSAAQWPKPSSVSLGERLTGVIAVSDERVTKKDAIAHYVVALNGAGDPQAKLLSDAERQLQAADRLIRAAENAADAVRPAMSDVAIVESVISDLRQARDIYLASLEEIAVEDTSDTRRAIKADFNRSIAEIGRAADVLADRVANDRTRTMAQPRSQSNFMGSL